MTTLDRPICLVGAPRSGTGFLSRVLREHEDLAFWDCPKYIWRHGNAGWPNDCLEASLVRPRVARYIRRRFADYTTKAGRKRYFDRTPQNVLALDFVNAILPDCKFIHIIRDGRDVAASTRKSFREAVQSVPSTVVSRVPGIPITDWPYYVPEFLRIVGNRLMRREYRYAFGAKIREWERKKRDVSMLEFTGIVWRECVEAGRESGRRLPRDRYYELRFETLFEEPERIVRELLEFCALPPSARVMSYISTRIDPAARGRWQKRMQGSEFDVILPHVRSLLEELGYA
jgi:hypothetical protein